MIRTDPLQAGEILFHGLNLPKHDLDLKVTPLGNPAMPMKLPEGPTWLKGRELPVPTSVMSLLPAFESMATHIMRKTMDKKGIARIEELLELCIAAEVKLVACQMTVDLFDYRKEDLFRRSRNGSAPQASRGGR